MRGASFVRWLAVAAFVAGLLWDGRECVPVLQGQVTGDSGEGAAGNGAAGNGAAGNGAAGNGTVVGQTAYWNDGARFNWSGGVVLNNQWGKGSANPGYYQAIVQQDNGSASFWYQWWGDDNSVKGYPAVIFGWHWGYYTPYGQYGLPYQVGQGKSLNIQFSGAHRNLGNYQKLNFAWDIWLAYSANPNVPNHEIMIWPYRVQQYPIGNRVETVNYWGASWDLHSGSMSDGKNTWYVFSFIRTSNSLNVQGNLADFINHVYRKGWVPAHEYVVGVELGTEVIQGHGEFDLYSYKFDGAR
eukprot:TRINITY_DN1552_c0_g1_i1.p1 TRINITY_DN1552_c0_g1~~TRINITY_DN1552_c0_g1_i1.p1  ORF type:complete len:298 (+),score=25.48 TRINITY_DN1552_c0_g1_i1:93-986(+)